ncbi:MAG: YIP1 family protein [Chthoniobacterales bacterium]|nr:YIP1 family protein [Chthoniobacterales bacterium]
MSNIHIARNHQSLGSFSEEAVREGIHSGRFSSGDLAWREGMAEWRPLGEIAPQWGMEIPAPSLDTASLDETPFDALPAEGNSPAWEERESLGFFAALSQTIGDVLLRPTQTFASMKQTGGLANPLLYFVLLSSAMFAVSAFYQIAMTTMNPGLFAAKVPHASSLPTGSSFSVALIGSVLLSPALYVVSAFISSGITHLCLKLLGGANRPFETTFRVICYAQASAAVLNIIPICGSLIGVIWGAYAIIIGLKEAQCTEGWRATLAITLPGLLCCGLLLLLGTAAGFGIAELSHQMGGGMPTLPKLP